MMRITRIVWYKLMIRVIDLDDTLSITCSVSEFVFGMNYCEYKIPFYIGGIKPPKNAEVEMRTSEGRSGHKKEEKIEIEKIEKGEMKPVTNEQMFAKLQDIDANIEFTREHVTTKLSFRTNIEDKNINLVLSGRADKISRENGCLIVYEDKFPKNPLDYEKRSSPFSSQVMQALIYLNSRFKKKDFTITIEDMWTCQDLQRLVDISKSFEIPHKDKKWIINIRDRNACADNNIIKTFCGIQTDQDKIYIESNLYRFVGIVLGYKEKIHHDNIRKCNPCEYASMCKYKKII